MNDLPSTRAEAIKQGSKRYFTGKRCKRGHVAERYVSGPCVECEHKRRKALKVCAANKEYMREYMRKRYTEDPKHRDKQKEYRQANRDNHRKYMREYIRNNAEKFNAITAKRRAAKLNRTPAWLTSDDFRAIEGIYATAKLWTEQTGEPWHVDHIVPLQGENVSGLHVAENLRVIPASLNMTKGNKHVVE